MSINRAFSKLALFFVIATLVMIPGFYRNQWGIVDSTFYNDWQKIFEYNVVARLVKSQQDGLFSAGGFIGIGDVTEWNIDRKVIEHQYEVYQNGGKFTTYWAYASVPGFEGVVFSLFDRLTSFSPVVKIRIFRATEAIATALVLATFAIWLGTELSWLAAAAVLVYIVLSNWLTLLAGNIYWNLWSFYLPLVASLFLLRDAAKKNSYPEIKILLAILILMLVKILFNGFEFITSALIIPTVPFVYFAVRDRWGWKLFLTRMLKLGISLVAALVGGLLILGIQIAALYGTASASLNYILATFQRRSFGDPQNYSGIYADAMRASTFSVIVDYLNIPVFSLRPFGSTINFTYLHLFILFAIFTGLFFLLNRLHPDPTTWRAGLALVIATWYSMAAPLSWYIVFKAHAYIHNNLDPAAWQMPFTLFGVALCGFVLMNLVRFILQIGQAHQQPAVSAPGNM